MGSRGSRIAAAMLALAAVTAGVAVSFLRANTVYTGVRIDGIELGGLTVQQAKTRLEPVANELALAQMTLGLGDEIYITTFREIGGVVDTSASARSAYKVGREGNVFRRIADIVAVRRHGRPVPVVYSFDGNTAADYLRSAARGIDREPVNAELALEGDSVRVTPGKPGVKLDIEKSLERLSRAANSGSRDIALVVGAASPEITEDDLAGIDGVIASYSTPYKPWERDRSYNLGIACRAINGTLLRSGETFSYNKVVGPRLKKRGFRDALMFVDGEVEPGTGGGICQVSTTVYNTALLADTKILRRSHHSRPVVYAPVGRDATVAYPALDLRFQNTSESPMYILASVGKRTVNVTILGRRLDGRTVELVSAGHRVLGAPVKKVTRDGLASEKPAVVEKGRSGHRVSTYRVVKQDGKVVKRELISSDYYRPESRVVAVPRPAPKPMETEPQPPM